VREKQKGERSIFHPSSVTLTRPTEVLSSPRWQASQTQRDSSLSQGISFLQPKQTYEIPRGRGGTGSTSRRRPRRRHVGHHRERRSSICGKAPKRCATDQSGGNGDQNGGTGRRPDASSRDSVTMQQIKAAASKKRIQQKKKALCA
jgi:hypothetical protein